MSVCRIFRHSLDNDKVIGLRPLIRFYTNSDKQTQTYLSNALQTKSNPQFNYHIHDAVIDTISAQTDDIKNIKLELITVNAKLKQLLNAFDNYTNPKPPCMK